MEHFSNLLNISAETDESILDEFENLPIKHELDHPITEPELDKAIKNTKLGKSPGPDGILPETLVYGGQALKNYLFTLFTTFWITENLPPDMINPYLTVLFKKGDRSNCGNYRGISHFSALLASYWPISSFKGFKPYYPLSTLNRNTAIVLGEGQ